MPRIFKGVSILIHAIVIGTISYVQIFDPELLPSPSSVIAYQIPIEIDRNIPLPSPPSVTPQESRAGPGIRSWGW